MDASEIKNYRRGKLIHIRLSPKTHQRLKVRVAELGTTMQRYVSRTVRASLLPPKPKTPKVPKTAKQPKDKPSVVAPKEDASKAIEATKQAKQTKGMDK